MDASELHGRCAWPGCARPAAHELPIETGMRLTVSDVVVEGSTFTVCTDHAPRAARAYLDAVDNALREHAARTNFAPGDAEWNETFDRET